MIQSDGIATDMLVMRGLTQLTDMGRYVVCTTPSEPDYWFGNCLIERHAPSDPAEVADRFATHFPQVSHVCIQWDLADYAMDAAAQVWFQEHGYSVEKSAFLTLAGSMKSPAMPEGLTVRAIDGDDWTSLTDLMEEIGRELGYGDSTHRTYLERRNAARRDQIARGEGQWFGVFDGDVLAAAMGIFHDDRVARYQAVETRQSYRRRGICSALLKVAHDWADARQPGLRFVIAADADGDARRLYERAGFVPHEQITAVMRRGY